jgi:hypothetical protein
MTNLPTHLQERIEQQAAKEAVEKASFIVQKTRRDGYEDGYEQGHLAGASFLYSLLKEEKGEVAGVWRKGLKTPQDSEWKIIVVENVARTAKYNKDSGYFIDTRGNLFEPKTLKWLDTETPVVAGCGELVEALELAEVELKAMYKRLGFKGSNVLDKVTESLKNV